MSFLLDLAYGVGATVASPYLVYKALTSEKFRTGYGERLGDVVRRRGEGPCVWVHAVSVGEMNLVRPLVAGLEEGFPDWELVLSAGTNTGMERAGKLYPEHRAFYYPLDFSCVVKRVVGRVRPSVVVLVELEVWPHFVAEAWREAIPLAIVNGRISDRSFPWYRRLRWVMGRAMGRLSVCCVQNEAYAERFVALGVPRERVVVTGNLKFDACPERAPEGRDAELAASFGLGADEPLIVGGCTWPGEDEALVSAYQALREDIPGLRLLLAPRQADRFGPVERLVRDAGLGCVRRTALRDGTAGDAAGDAVIVLDTMGELASVYGLATVAFVGGSLTPCGGHATMEPSGLARPVVFGPHTENFRDVNDELLAHDAARRVADGAELEATLRELILDPATARALGTRAREVVDRHRGATRRTLEALKPFFDSPDQQGSPSR